MSIPAGGSKGQGGKGKGSGTGDGGQGSGPPPEGTDEGKTQETRVSGKIDARGKAIASMYILGIPEAGPASAEYKDVMRTFERKVRDSLGKEEIPLGYREAIKNYFESVCPRENR